MYFKSLKAWQYDYIIAHEKKLLTRRFCGQKILQSEVS